VMKHACTPRPCPDFRWQYLPENCSSTVVELAKDTIRALTHLNQTTDSSRTMSAKDSKVLKTEPLDSKDARWTRLIKTVYTDPLGKERTWEHAERPTRPKNSEVDGVGIVAILDKPSGPEIILQKQFRPPINAVTIEVPAGLVDA